MKTYHCLI